MKDRIRRAVFWLIWSRGVLQALSFLSTLVVVRLLSPSDYGLMALAGVWTAIVSLLTEVGLGAAIVQFQDVRDEELNACFWLTMGLAAVGYLAVYGAAPGIAAWFDSQELSSVLRVAALVLLLVACRVVPDSLLRKRLAFDRLSQAEILSAVVTIPLVIGLAAQGAGVWALVTGSLAGPFVHTVASYWFVRWRPGLRIGGRRLKAIMNFSLTTLGSRLCWAAYAQADTFVLGKVAGDATVGLYAMAKQVATLPVGKISEMVNQLAAPVLAELQSDQAAMRRSLLRGVRMVACVSFPLCTGLLLVADDLVQAVLTEKWRPAVPMLQVLCVYAMIKSVAVLLPPVLLARYRNRFLLGYALLQLGLLPPAFWAGAVWAGAVGVALVWVLFYPLVMTWMLREALREVALAPAVLWRELGAARTATAALLVAAITARWALHLADLDHAAVRLVVVSLCGGAAYVMVLLRGGGPVVDELREVLGWMVGVRKLYVRT